MQTKAVKIIKLAYKATVTVASILLGLAFILQILNIYLDGTAPGHEGDIFTRELVAEKLAGMSVYIIVWITIALFGIVFYVIFPEKYHLPKISSDYFVERCKKRFPKEIDGATVTAYNEVVRVHNVLRVMKVVSGALSAGLLLFIVVYVFIPGNMPSENPTKEIIKLVGIILPIVAVVFAIAVGTAMYSRKASSRLLPLAKDVMGKNKTVTKKENIIERLFDNKAFVLGLRVAVGVVGAMFVVIGIANGGARDVFVKAVNICTECIGLG